MRRPVRRAPGLPFALVIDLLTVAFAKGAHAQTPPAAQPTAGIEITRNDDGATRHAVVGQEVTVRLGADLDWMVSYNPPGILTAVPGVNTRARDVQGILRAAQPGTVQIAGTGKPHCDPGRVCAQVIIDFSATVVVDPALGGGSPGGVVQKPRSPGTVTITRPPAGTSAPLPGTTVPRPGGIALPNTGTGAQRSGRPVTDVVLLVGLIVAALCGGLGVTALCWRKARR